jgi:hypothetical protein
MGLLLSYKSTSLRKSMLFLGAFRVIELFILFSPLTRVSLKNSNTHHPEIGNSTAIQVEFKKFGNSREFKEFYNECA